MVVSDNLVVFSGNVKGFGHAKTLHDLSLILNLTPMIVHAKNNYAKFSTTKRKTRLWAKLLVVSNFSWPTPRSSKDSVRLEFVKMVMRGQSNYGTLQCWKSVGFYG